MDFRWAVGIALWTMFIGPIFGPPVPRPTEPKAAASTAHEEPQAACGLAIEKHR